ncbi:hypothetical protein AB833_16400 [Chromatiales bacterium (ex Bugula neritina AB1)]|nr:hypothetical protein AB833_16400 [Chromatiales bacterium (ex Bugula neritina AB1)]
MKHRKLALVILAGVAVVAMLAGCATPKVGSDFTAAGNAIRAAEVAGARTYAPEEYAAAQQIHRKAEKLLLDGRLERAQKLLQIAAAQADLATAISEAEHAEESLRHLQTASSQ